MNCNPQLIVEMLLDELTLNVFRPVLPLFYESRSINTMLFKFNISLQHTQATVKNHNIAPSKDGLQHLKQQSNSFSLTVEFGMVVDGASFPSTNSSCQRMPANEHHTMWYLLPKGHGVLGTNIHPGQVYLFIHVLMDSSKQLTQPSVNCSTNFVLHTFNMSLTSNN